MMRDSIDQDRRFVILIILIAIIFLVQGAFLFYFRKKENDSLHTLFQIDQRLNMIEQALRTQREPSEPPK